jgi:hypothetical protein
MFPRTVDIIELWLEYEMSMVRVGVFTVDLSEIQTKIMKNNQAPNPQTFIEAIRMIQNSIS